MGEKAQELADVREIIDVMNQYTTALDSRNWAMLEDTMTPDGQADFGNLAGVGHPRQPAGARRALPQVAAGPEGDAASPGQLRRRGERRHRAGELLPPGEPLRRGPARRRQFVVWAKYRDDFVRTENGWKIKKRYLDTIHAGGNMNLFAEAAEAAGRTANA